MDTLTYKGFEGTAEPDMDRNVCRGKILSIDDLVTYESDTLTELQSAFEEAVDDYLETCKMLGRPNASDLDRVLPGEFSNADDLFAAMGV